jgi:hypothetical protein
MIKKICFDLLMSLTPVTRTTVTLGQQSRRAAGIRVPGAAPSPGLSHISPVVSHRRALSHSEIESIPAGRVRVAAGLAAGPAVSG